MGAKVIDFQKKQNEHQYNQLINAFREYRFKINNEIHQTYMQLVLEENKDCLQYLTNFYEHFEDANLLVEYYISNLNKSDIIYKEKIELLNCLMIYYLRYLEALKQGENYFFGEVINEIIDTELARTE